MSDDIHQILDRLMTQLDTLCGWERAFLKSAAGCPSISDSQARVIRRIAARQAT